MNEARTGAFPAVILAAGYGTRLAPVTDYVPKPLLPVRGRALIDHAIAAVTAAGAGPVAVNTHHLADQVAAHLAARADSDRFHVGHEPEILGTGGALDGLRDHLRGHPFFLLHNADVLCDADLGRLVDEHERTGAEVTLLLADWPAVNTVTLGAEGAITAIGPDPAPGPAARRLTYTGIGVFGAEILGDVPTGFSSLIDPLRRAIADRPGAIRGFSPTDFAWHDLGMLGRWLGLQGPEPDQAAGPGRLTALTGHGSDRRFWRLAVPGWSAVAMLAGPDDEEFQRGAEIASFLHEIDVGGAEVLVRDDAAGALLMADLGADSLEDVVRRGLDPGPPYAAVLETLLALQGATDRARTECPAATDRRLDAAVLTWETGYFAERFLAGHLGIDVSGNTTLAAEFQALAAAVEAQPVVLMHRDLQSRNVMMRDGAVGLVDVQGMRLGPVGYDVMSLVWDPYVDLPEAMRIALLEAWVDRAVHLPALAGHTGEEVRAMALAAGLQRLMQALGAFGFLGRVKGKTEFLDHVPRGLANLAAVLAWAEAAGTAGSDAGRWLPAPFPALRAVLARCGDGSTHRPLDGGGAAG